MTELTRLAEWTTPREEIDHLGHMSTLFYAVRSDRGAAQLLEGAIGGDLAAAGLVAVTVDRHTLFRREQLAGAPLTLAGGVAAAEGTRAEIYEEMANAATGEVAAMFRLGVELQDRVTRRAVPLPAALLAAPRAHPPAKSAPRSLPLERAGADLTPGDFAGAGLEPHLRREITPDMCDEFGFLVPAPPRLLGPGGPRNPQGVLDNVWQTVPGFVWPALEMRILALRPIRQGDVLETYSALLSVGHKVIHSGLWTFEAASRALVQVVHQVNIFFNFETRRPQDMPPEVRARLDAVATPDLILRPG